MTGTSCPRPSALAEELETYIPFPPMQDPATYNLEQVVRQVQQMKTSPGQ